MKKLLLLCFGTIFSVALYAQKNVKGSVIDAESKFPISGASISIKGSNLGAVSDEKGIFQLNVPQNYSKIIVSAVGYVSQELNISDQMNVALETSKSINLDEVLVVGYGTKSKKDVTSSISRVTAKDFQEQPVSTFEQALQGRSSGVFINAGSGKLGQGLKIRVRGISSISANQQPFVVIDGVPVVSQSLSSSSEPDNPLATLNPDDIESIEVLKDASSSAIYGARASNGVLLVTTKSGKKGKTKVNVGVSYGWTTPTHYQEFLNADQYRALFTEAAKNVDYDAAEEFEGESGSNDWNETNNTNWSRAAFQNGYVKQYTASLTGGDAKTRFLFSGSYNDQKGIIIGNRLSRATGRINLDHNINSIFKVGANISLNQTNNYRVSSDNAFSNPVQLNALPPIQPMYDKDDGLLNRNTLYYNSLIEVEGNNRNINNIYRTISSAFLEANILNNLKFRSQNGIDWTNLQESNFLGRRTEDGAPGGYSYEGQTTSAIFTSTNTLSWLKGNDNYNIDALAGIEYQNGKITGMDVTGKAFPSDKFTRITSAAIISGGSSTATQYRFLSYFLRTNLKLFDKYLIGASVRADGSSRFSKNKPYGVFPAISAGWIMSEENFLKNSSVISFLKLRTSYGRTGNAEIGNFSSLTLFSSGAYANVAGIIASQIGDPNLSWEKTDQFDIGLDFGIAKNRVSGEIDYFFKNTKDLLLNVPLPSVNGFTSITKNIGDMENRGIEFVLNADIIRNNNLKWTSSFNISTYRNKVTKLVAPVLPSGRNLGRLAVDAPFGQFYTKKYMGVDPANGDALYMAADGSKTNDYSAAVDTVVGNPNPDFFGGWSNKFSYKGFELNILFQFVKGGDIYNLAGIFQSVNGDYFDNQTVDQMKYWKKPGDITSIPQPRLYDGNGTSKSSRWVQDGSYLRFKSVTLNYNLPKNLSKKIGAENVKIFVSGQNLLTSTKYTGYDPEVNTQFIGSVNLNHDFYTPPLAKTFLIGINIDL